jgi:hypothetical protein
MGRITPSWRTIYHRTIDRLRRRTGFYQKLREKQHQEAFNLLLRVLGRESAALGNANVPAMMMEIKTLISSLKLVVTN